jgi:hypothetical protein
MEVVTKLRGELDKKCLHEKMLKMVRRRVSRLASKEGAVGVSNST